MDDLSDNRGDYHTPDMVDSDDDNGSCSDDEADGPEVEMEIEEVWKLTSDMFPGKFLSQFSRLNPALGDLSLVLFSDAFKIFFDDEMVGK